MALLPTAEQSARKILLHFVKDLSYRPGRAITNVQLEHLPIPRPEVIEGIDFARKNGWIETTEDGNSVLTKSGFAQT